MNKETENTKSSKSHLLHRPCSAFFRPRNGNELIQALANGKTCEVPNGWGIKALKFIESRLSNWSIYLGGSTNKGWEILRPTGDTSERFRQYLQNRQIGIENDSIIKK